MAQIAIVLVIGLLAGILGGFVGVGGGVLIVSRAGADVRLRSNISRLEHLAGRLCYPPVGILGAYEYYKHGHLNLTYRAAAGRGALLIGGYFGAVYAVKLPGTTPAPHLWSLPPPDPRFGCCTNKFSRLARSKCPLLSSRCGSAAGSGSHHLLLESERAGVIALSALIADVEHDELKQFLSGSRAMEQRNAEELEALIRDNRRRSFDQDRTIRRQSCPRSNRLASAWT